MKTFDKFKEKVYKFKKSRQEKKRNSESDEKGDTSSQGSGKSLSSETSVSYSSDDKLVDQKNKKCHRSGYWICKTYMKTDGTRYMIPEIHCLKCTSVRSNLYSPPSVSSSIRSDSKKFLRNSYESKKFRRNSKSYESRKSRHHNIKSTKPRTIKDMYHQHGNHSMLKSMELRDENYKKRMKEEKDNKYNRISQKSTDSEDSKDSKEYNNPGSTFGMFCYEPVLVQEKESPKNNRMYFGIGSSRAIASY